MQKLYIIQKVPKGERVDTKKFLVRMNRACESEPIKAIKDLTVPDHLLCKIKGDLMDDPVMIQSGVTYERQIIEQFFKL